MYREFGGGGGRRGPIYRENEPPFSAKTPSPLLFPRFLWVPQGEKILWLISGFSLVKQKHQGKEGQGRSRLKT